MHADCMKNIAISLSSCLLRILLRQVSCNDALHSLSLAPTFVEITMIVKQQQCNESVNQILQSQLMQILFMSYLVNLVSIELKPYFFVFNMLLYMLALGSSGTQRNAPGCPGMHRDATECTGRHRNATGCIRMQRNALLMSAAAIIAERIHSRHGR